MGKPDSPLKLSSQGSAGEKGGALGAGTTASLCGNCQRAEGPAPRDPTEPGTQERCRSQAAESEQERLRTLGSGVSAG